MPRARLAGTLASRRAVGILLLALVAAPAWAQLGQSGPGDGAPAPGSPASPTDPGDELAAILAKIDARTPITRREFMVYLRAIEAQEGNRRVIQESARATASEDLPGKAWALISTKLHNFFYSGDRTLSFFGIDLFLNGSENQGWEEIDYLSGRPPKFLLDPASERVDVGHSYAGVAALVMRDGEVAGTLMGHVNTGWGDSVQVWGERIRGSANMVVGVFSAERRERGRGQLERAPDFKPPDQVRGNDLGNAARDYLQDHRDHALSAAFDHAFEEVAD